MIADQRVPGAGERGADHRTDPSGADDPDAEPAVAVHPAARPAPAAIAQRWLRSGRRPATPRATSANRPQRARPRSMARRRAACTRTGARCARVQRPATPQQRGRAGPARGRCSAAGRAARPRACARSRRAAAAARRGTRQEAVAPPRQRPQQPRPPRGVRVRVVRPRAEHAVLERRAATRPRAASGSSRRSTRSTSARVPTGSTVVNWSRLVSVDAAPGEPVDRIVHQPAGRHRIDCVTSTACMRPGGSDLGDGGEQAERDPHAVGRRGDRVAQRPRDRAHPVRAEADAARARRPNSSHGVPDDRRRR